MLVPLGIVPHAIQLLTEGKANTNYRVETIRGPLVLRLYQRDLSAAMLEETVVELLPSEFPAPRVLARGRGFSVWEFAAGATLERLLTKGKALPWERLAEDLARVRLALNAQRCGAAGFFGDLHKIPWDVPSTQLPIPDPWPSAIEGLLAWLRHLLPTLHLATDKKDRLARVVDDAEPRLQAIAGPPVLVHGDFKPSNLLVDDSGLTALLDWEFAHAGTWLSDVGQLLRHPESLPDGFADAFLEELDAPEDTMLLARTLDLTNLVDFLHRERGQPTMRRDVEARIVEVCALYEARFGDGP